MQSLPSLKNGVFPVTSGHFWVLKDDDDKKELIFNNPIRTCVDKKEVIRAILEAKQISTIPKLEKEGRKISKCELSVKAECKEQYYLDYNRKHYCPEIDCTTQTITKALLTGNYAVYKGVSIND